MSRMQRLRTDWKGPRPRSSWPQLPVYRLTLEHVPHLTTALRLAREAQGWSQLRLAALVTNETVTCSQTTICRLELGSRAPSLALALRLIEVLRLPGDVALQLRAESVLLRPKSEYRKPWLRPPGYRPHPNRRLGLEAAASNRLPPEPEATVPRFTYSFPSFATWR